MVSMRMLRDLRLAQVRREFQNRMRRMRRLPAEMAGPDVDSSLHDVRRELDDVLRPARTQRWAAPVGGLLALGLAAAAITRVMTG